MGEAFPNTEKHYFALIGVELSKRLVEQSGLDVSFGSECGDFIAGQTASFRSSFRLETLFSRYLRWGCPLG